MTAATTATPASATPTAAVVPAATATRIAAATGGAARHMPALDGLRALAVAAVIAYHLGYGWAGGGYLGVDLFFVLSGFLITGLLEGEHRRSGAIRLGAFWARRARRLLPALLLVLVAVTLYAHLGPTQVSPKVLRGDALSTLFYFANWHFIAAHNSYFAQFSAPSPLEHTWSLAIEEQFYVVWPLVILALLRRGGRRRRSTAMVAVTALAVASAGAMALLAHGTGDPSRAYFGTDSRVFELMVGAGLALLVQGRAQPGPRVRAALQVGGALGLALLVAGWSVLGGPPAWMFTGGFLAAAVIAAVVIAAVIWPDNGPLGRILSLPALRWVGRVSYGLYLWHWPVFVFVDQQATGLSGAELTALRLGLTVAVTTLSYYLLEQPIRRRGLAGWKVLAAPAAAAATATVIVATTIPVATAGVAGLPAGLRSPQRTASGNSAPAPVRPHVFGLGRTPTPADPVRILVIGDSVMQDAESGVAAALQATGVVRVTSMAFPGWGLTHSATWVHDVSARIASDHPDVVMGTWSWDQNAAWSQPASYRATLERAIALVLSPGDGVRGVVFLEFPRVGVRYGETAEGVGQTEQQRRAWNSMVAGEARDHPDHVAYLPVSDVLDLDGGYASWLPAGRRAWVRARSTDNTHLCPAGTARVASDLVADVAPSWGLPAPDPAWLGAAWVHDPLYDTPPGACPDDQPPASFVAAHRSSRS
ncbi:MAG TPA: acyltransferase family protein [Acidimicrobiales bacterium]|nr:acyltransferase family protein [Acidimicrobiales bacterium]